MKKLTLFLLLAFFAGVTQSFATKYCGENIDGVSVTCVKSGNNYVMTFEGTGFNGLGGTYYNPNGVALNTKVTENTETKIVCTLDVAPNFYTPIYIVKKAGGEYQFSLSNIEWITSCGGGEEPVPTASNYCQQTIESNDKSASIQLTCTSSAQGSYQIIIEGENLNGLGGSFYDPGAVDIRSMITTSTSTKIVIDIEAASAPNIYTPLYVLMPGEKTFAWPNDIVWGQCSSDPIAVEGVSITSEFTEIEVNQSMTMTAAVTPSNATNKNVTWSITSGEEEGYASINATTGLLTGKAAGEVTVQVMTEDGNKTATKTITVVAAKPSAPSAAPDAPTHSANKVKAVYSATYSADCGFGEWGSGTAYTQDTYGKKYVMNKSGYFGMVIADQGAGLNCSSMEYLHADVWVKDNTSIRFVPIHGGTEYGVTKQLTGGQWNSIDIALTEGDWANITNWSDVYQIKIDNASYLTLWFNNVYFYTTSEETKYAVSAIAGDGGSATASASSVTSGTEVTFTATAEDCGYTFSSWTKGGEVVTGAGATYTTAITEETTLKANFTTTFAPVTPTHETTNVMTVYGDYGNQTGLTVNPWWDYQTTQYNETTIGGKTMARYTKINFQGMDFDANRMDVSDMQYVHLDLYASVESDIKFSLIWQGGEHSVTKHLNGCTIESLDIPLSEFTGIDLKTIRQLKFDAQGLSLAGHILIVQNIYFYKLPPAPVTGVSLDKTEATLKIGKTLTLTATVAPANAGNKNVTWSSDKEGVATVKNGVVTAVAEGTANITVTTKDGGFTATCTVTVTAAPVITNPYCGTEVGHFLSQSADPNSFILLSIGSDGEGHTIVNIKQDAAKNTNKFDYLEVSGHASTGADVETGGVTEMAVKFATPTPDVNGDITLEILWSTVGWSGRWMVQNLKVPATATCASAVVPEVPEAEVKTYYGYLKHAEKGVYVGYSITRNKDNTLTFNAQVDSETNIAAAYINVKGTELGLTKNVDTYSAKTSATFIEGASLDNTYFHFILEGTANIADIPVTTYTVGASNEPITTFPTEKVTLDKANLSFGVGDADQTLTARVYPNFATNTTVAWTTSAEGVATVSNGSVHPVAAGDATITATCVGKTATCAVNVVAALEDASYYGTGSFKTPIDNSYVAYNYNITRKANHEVILTVVFERDVTSYIGSTNFQFYENNTNHQMTYTAATQTATYSFGNKTDGSEIKNFYFYFVLNGGGVAQTAAFTYSVGATNEQPNKLIALNEVVANMLTNGETVDALIARTFAADGFNYTLCLPFDMTPDQCLDAFGEGYKLFLLGAPYMKTTDMMYLPFSEVTSIEAGKPYLFCPAANVVNPTIEGVTINAAAPASIGNAWAKMTGIYSPATVAESNYVLGDDNWLYQSDGTPMYGLRCYFTFGSSAPVGVRARAVFHNTDVVTDLETVDGSQCTMHDGKYVINGQFVIIRNNVRYNGIGHQVK